MQSEIDIRWKQRFENYKKALTQLESAVQLAGVRPLSNLEEQGMIKAYEFNYELAWNLIKDYLVWQGFDDIVGSRDAFRTAFNRGIVSDGKVWMDMVRDRNMTTHIYDEAVADTVIKKILTTYYPAVQLLKTKFETYAEQNQ